MEILITYAQQSIPDHSLSSHAAWEQGYL